MKRTLSIAAAMAATFCATAHADDQTTASAHAPLGVMGDHLHNRGEFMFSYRYMHMDMDGSRIGTRRVSARDTVGTMNQPGQFLVAPISMPMDMHMLGAMYGLSDNITLMGMASYASNSMDHLIRNGREFTTRSSGIGDTKLSALVSLFDNGHHKVHWQLGVSLPTGSTTEVDDTPAMKDAFLPYMMQIGSGTYDLLPAVTYSGRNDTVSWGAQLNAVIRTGDNDQSYTLGDQLGATSWIAKDLNDHLSLSLRVNYQDKDAIDGRNPALNPSTIQTAVPALQEGDRVDLSLGVNYLFANGHRLAIEYASPIRQDLVGPQLEIDSVLTLGWQKAF
ncbi:MAG: hypothetical protein JKX81_11895 [Arenicella sp.]|nr:hypothetical protein [Arenicella sp.]